MKKYQKSLFVGILSLFFASCGKQEPKNEKLGKTFYTLCMLELSDRDGAPIAYKKALEYIDQALVCEKKPSYLALRGTILINLGLFDQSLKALQDALAGNPEAALRGDIMNNIACLCAQRGDVERAIEIWNTLIADAYYLTPEVALVNMGKVCAQQGDLLRAKESFMRAITLAPSYVDAHYYLSLVAFKLSDESLVKNELQTLLFMEPKHKGAIQLQSLLISTNSSLRSFDSVSA